MPEGSLPTPKTATAEKRAVSKVPPHLQNYLALKDFEEALEDHLPRMLWGFVTGAAETDWSLRDNAEAYQDYAFIPRTLVNTTKRSTGTTLFGRSYAQPFGIPPMGASALIAYRGDIALAQAAAVMNVPNIMSASSLIKLEDIRKAGPTTWYQAYLPGEPARIEPLVDRVAAAGFDTFVLTVDVPVSANRENNFRNGYSIPLKPNYLLLKEGVTHPKWLFGTFLRTFLAHGMPYFENMDAGRGPPILSRNLVRAVGKRDGLSWEHLALIRRRWKGKLVVKGILAAEDAAMCADHGADGVIVSTHGGRQLDGAIGPLRVLPEVKAASQGMAVMIDSGIRRGSDVLKALALGADFCFVGRPMLAAAALAGEPGVRHALTLLGEEVDRNMAMLGVNRIAEICAQHVRKVR